METPIISATGCEVGLVVRTLQGLGDIPIARYKVDLTVEQEEWLIELDEVDADALLSEIAIVVVDQIEQSIKWEKDREEPDPDRTWGEE